MACYAEAKAFLPIHREAPPFTEQSTEQEVLVTGIKVLSWLDMLVQGRSCACGWTCLCWQVICLWLEMLMLADRVLVVGHAGAGRSRACGGRCSLREIIRFWLEMLKQGKACACGQSRFCLGGKHVPVHMGHADCHSMLTVLRGGTAREGCCMRVARRV